MKFLKIFLLSDIHGDVSSLRKLDKLARSDQPCFINGDLFDHTFGNEREIVSTLTRMIKEHRGYVTYGNHDVPIECALFKKYDDNTSYKILTREKNSKKFKIFKYLFDNDFYVQHNKLIESLKVNLITLQTYYQQMRALLNSRKYLIVKKQMMYLFTNMKYYYNVEIDNYHILISHSGDVNDVSSRATMKQSFKLNPKYHFAVIGHLITTEIDSILNDSVDMLDRKHFTNTVPFNICINGNYVYNSFSKTIMIDDATHQNIVTINV